MNPIEYLIKSALIPAYVIVGIIAVIAALDKERKAPPWARNSLLMFAATAIISGVLGYLLASRHLGNFVIGSMFKWQKITTGLQDVSFGMFLVLVQSGYLWGHKKTEAKHVS